MNLKISEQVRAMTGSLVVCVRDKERERERVCVCGKRVVAVNDKNEKKKEKDKRGGSALFMRL